MAAVSGAPLVLITGARAPAALDLARAFRAAGVRVRMADCGPSRAARLSKAPEAVHAYASPVTRPEAFAQDVEDLVDALAPSLVVPTCEEVFHLAALAERRPTLAATLFAPPLARLRTLHSKRLFAQACLAEALPVPRTWSLTGPEDLADLPPAGELVLKPEYSRFGVHALIRPAARQVADLPISPERPWVAQAFVAGTEVSFYAVARGGRLAAFCAYGSAWRDRGGASYAFATPPDMAIGALRGLAERLAERLVGDGQFACDVIMDAEGAPWLLECNPRATSGVHLFQRDAAFGRALLADGPLVEPGAPPPLHVAPALWLLGLPAALRERRLADWNILRRDGRDVLTAPGDRAPLVGALIDSAAFGLKALATGRSLAAAMTADIEWNGDPA
ncbi:MAG: ATP-dependent carboxylate-amine ligase [Caulobacter sp.]